LVDGYGDLARGREEDDWLGVESQDHTLEQVTTRTQLVVIFVHGYNTSSARAVEIGERLRGFVCEGEAQGCPNARLYSFLWRGDLNPGEFRAAQNAATNSAYPLADFVRRLHDRRPELPILVISHSLGARVVLEGLGLLRQSEASQWVDAVVLIQPAVHVGSVSKWMEPRFGYGFLGRSQNEGRYWEVLKSAGRVIATVSAGDRTLQLLFPVGQELTTEPYRTALGSATNLADLPDYTGGGLYGTYTFTEAESPVESYDISPLDHSDIFGSEKEHKKHLASLWLKVRAVLDLSEL
ncbi:MAG: alpha/beta hydrolase, partial [Gammaproteobacteria bacterium]